MKRNLFFVVLCSLLGILFFSCASTGQPAWVNEPEKMYSAEKYISAVGHGIDRNTAEENALASLAKRIRQDLTVTTVTVERASAGDAGNSSEYVFNQEFGSVSAIRNLAGAKIQSVWNNKENGVFALALLNKQEASAYYADKIKTNNSTMAKYISFSRENPGTFGALASLTQAAKTAEMNEAYLDILSLADPASRAVLQRSHVSAAELAFAAEQAARDIRIVATMNSAEAGRLADTFTDEFADLKVVLEQPSGDETYLFDITLVFDKTQPMAGTENVFVRYQLTALLTEKKGGKVLYSFVTNGREAHVSEFEARQRALRTMDAAIRDTFAADFTAKMLVQN